MTDTTVSVSAKWRTIDSAPRDETHVLVCRFAGVLVDWAHEAWWPKQPHGTMWKYRSGSCSPTHWTELPEREEGP